LISFREIEIGDAKTILDWRTSEHITKFMNSDIQNNLGAQVKWIEDCFKNPTYYHWIIQYGGKDVGFLNFVNWNRTKKTTSWGFYIGEEDALGIGGMVAPYFYNFAFDILGVDKVFAEVFYNNIGIIELHLKQGYSFDAERDHVIEKNGKSILMVCMFLEKNIFQLSKFSRFKQTLPISQWKGSPDEF
jgi:UDP-4-amino-4,6-dideoxy-N-acetyl-beta-L-altrosamine N-acetyltransferase